MRILVMSHVWYPLGAGAQTAGHDLMRAMVRAGHSVEVLLSREGAGSGKREIYDGIMVHPHVDTGDPFHWFGTDTNTPHLVISHLESTIRAMVLARLHHVPHVHLLHNDMMMTRYQVREGPSDLVVYNTNWMRKRVRDWLLDSDVTPGRDIMIHPPVHVEDYRVTPGEMITQVNMFTGTKNPEMFYEMARRFPNQRFLAVLGAYGEQLVEELPNVEFVGPFNPDEMTSKVYARTKVLLMPSTYESYGRAAVEACCAGIPVLAGDTEGLREALGTVGIDQYDADAWERELRKVLTQRGWAAASKRARKVADELTTEQDLASFVEALESVARVGP